VWEAAGLPNRTGGQRGAPPLWGRGRKQMAAENHNGGRSPSDNPTKVDRSLDDLARELATSNVSRGRALKIMGSALLGSVLAAVPGVAWAADRCSEGQTRCGDRCVNLKTKERHCGSCSNRCGSKQTCCQGRCVNLQRSERHCGSCSNRCDDGEQCVRGECQGGCPPGETVCTGCACETVACTPGTQGCNPNSGTSTGGSCFANADGVGTTCACGFGVCTNDCSECANLGLVCVSNPDCAAIGFQFQCVGPCTPAA
jgi:hypothetical protein